MTAASCPEYAALDSLGTLEQFHAEIAMAERDGAIVVQRNAHHGDGSGLKRLQVCDLTRLAIHLGTPLHGDVLGSANEVLAPWRDRFPVVDAVLSTWAAGRKIRQHGPDAAPDLVDALRVAADALNGATRERTLRRESVRLFGDSKRIEALTPWLELLASGEIASSGLSREEIWSTFGLRRQPQPLLLAGSGHVSVAGESLPIVAPYMGLPPEQIMGIHSQAEFVLTVENLTSFHDAASLPDARPRLIIYSGGMPSPAWRRAWQCMVASISDEASLYHWGDIDEGGFRIAHAIQRTAHEIGKSIRPWMMSPESLPQACVDAAETPTSSELRRMCDASAAAGWEQVCDELMHRPIRLEQEALEARLPASRR
jgi:hypothetical protein